jgi:ATP-binding cassette subfamily C protein
MSASPKMGMGIVIDLLWAYPRQSVLMIAFLLLSGFAEGIGVMAFLPLISLATGGKTVDNSTLSIWTGKLFALVGTVPSLGGILLLVVAGISLKSVFTLFAMKEVGYSVAHVMTDLRLRLIRALLAVRWRYFVSQPVGALTNAISSEVVRAAQVYQSAAQMLALAIQALVYSALVLIVSWQVALVSVLVGGSIALIFRRLINAARSAGSSQTELLKSLTSRLTDALQGIKPIKAMGYETELLPLLESETEGLNDAQQRQVWSMELLRVLQEPLLTIVIAAGLYLALSSGIHSFAELMVMVFLFYRLLNRVHALQQTYQAVAVGESAYLSLRETIAHAMAEQEPDHGTLPAARFNQIRFGEVGFSYGDVRILDKLSLMLDRGDFVVITGPSGSGKTTLVDLVTRLIEPQSGEILIDNIPLSKIRLASWRKQIGYVPQEMLLLHDSIYKNVSLGAPDISRADVEAALKLAGAWHFIADLAKGMDTEVGERGAKLSGGQRQRISLARALARKPQLLILDEVTASLDPETEAEICDTLRTLTDRVTILAVSHQPAITRVAHRVYRLNDGRLSQTCGPEDTSQNATSPYVQ